ncbi:kelch-like protein 41b [Malaya genurostris]|uniref:kelch-like protein 41b n=1 Tax=Malaya genurostris TaxID=325434 RepID=UPI0026F3C79F|nr:kelch-like protein 41b [Malaya genurostris]XP_058443882.1 kelch-like protein 41b [Malaya genurostris]
MCISNFPYLIILLRIQLFAKHIIANTDFGHPTHQLESGKFAANKMSEEVVDSEKISHWDKIDYDEKPNYLTLINKRLNEFKHPNIQIRIGEKLFDCHALLLQCFSEVFDELGNEPDVTLPEEKVTPEAFQLIYEWLLSQKSGLQREHFVEVFVAAEYLRIPRLINQCWTYVNDAESLMEDQAFQLYLETIPFKHAVLQHMMLRRICRFFLTLVASEEFVRLPVEDLCVLLKSNFIGVFSESDVLYAAAVWLLDDWESRSEHVGEVMKLVCFPLMSPSLLSRLIRCEEDDRIRVILQHDTTKNLTIQALTGLFKTSSDQRFGLHNSSKPVHRTWLKDPTVSAAQEDKPLDYKSHHQECTFGKFMERLEGLTSNPNSWQDFETFDDVKYA